MSNDTHISGENYDSEASCCKNHKHESKSGCCGKHNHEGGCGCNHNHTKTESCIHEGCGHEKSEKTATCNAWTSTNLK